MGASSRRSHNETARPPKLTPQLLALEPEYRLVAAYIDAHIWNNWAIYATAALVEELRGSEEADGWNEDACHRTMRERWGANDQHGVYAAAGLTKAETEVAFLHYDRQLENVEIGRLLHKDPVNVGVLLFKARQRLKALSLEAAA